VILSQNLKEPMIIFSEIGSMQTSDFRRRLRQEANLWQQDGLIDRDFYLQLADRYQFDRIEDEASNRFVTILTGLGCVLIGLGVLSFVAANWQYLDKTWRIVVMLTAFGFIYGNNLPLVNWVPINGGLAKDFCC
jgi:uncharacterized membrane protein